MELRDWGLGQIYARSCGTSIPFILCYPTVRPGLCPDGALPFRPTLCRHPDKHPDQRAQVALLYVVRLGDLTRDASTRAQCCMCRSRSRAAQHSVRIRFVSCTCLELTSRGSSFLISPGKEPKAFAFNSTLLRLRGRVSPPRVPLAL